MSTKVPVTSETQGFWSNVHRCKSKGYIFWVETHTTTPRPELVPAGVSRPYGHWVRVPIIYHDLDLAVWGFETLEHAAAFVEAYGGESW